MRSILATLALCFTATAVAAEPDPLAAMAAIQAQSVAKFPEGTWVKATNAGGKAMTITIVSKAKAAEGWTLTSRIEPGGEVTSTVGSRAALEEKQGKITSMGEETIEVAGKQLACTVFTFASGQKHWMSPEVPGGGVARIRGPQGEEFLTVLKWGDPQAKGAAASQPS